MIFSDEVGVVLGGEMAWCTGHHKAENFLTWRIYFSRTLRLASPLNIPRLNGRSDQNALLLR